MRGVILAILWMEIWITPCFSCTYEEKLWESLVKEQGYGYVLAGLKPIASWDLFLYPLSNCKCQYHAIPMGILDELKWKRRYLKSVLYEDETFCLSQYRSPSHISLFFINKPLLKKTINQNLDLFQQLPDFSTDKFISWLCKGGDFWSSMGNRDDLLGIMLGFGRENATYFQSYFRTHPGLLKPMQGSSNMSPLFFPIWPMYFCVIDEKGQKEVEEKHKQVCKFLKEHPEAWKPMISLEQHSRG